MGDRQLTDNASRLRAPANQLHRLSARLRLLNQSGPLTNKIRVDPE